MQIFLPQKQEALLEASTLTFFLGLIWLYLRRSRCCPQVIETLISCIFEMGGRCPYSCFFVGCCLQGLFNTPRSILVQSPLSFSPYALSASMWCIRTAILIQPLFGKKLRFILSDKSDFHMTDSLSIAVQAFTSHVLISFLVNETLLSRLENLSTSFRELPFSVEMLI